jgi:CHASE3 domain sensor protein
MAAYISTVRRPDGTAPPPGMRPEQVRAGLIATAVVPSAGLRDVAGLLLWQMNQLLEAGRWVAHTDHVIVSSDRALNLIVDMETGLRGYQLTGDRVFLEPGRSGNRPGLRENPHARRGQ